MGAVVVKGNEIDLDLYTRFLLQHRHLSIPTGANWVSAVTNSGTTDSRPGVQRTSCSTSATSTALLRSSSFLLADASTGIDLQIPNWIFLTIRRDVSEAESVAYWQIKAATTIGDLGAVGLGLKISNLTVVGEVYGTERATTSTLATLTSGEPVDVAIHHDPVAGFIRWYVRESGIMTLKATTTDTDHIPDAVVDGNILQSMQNGASGGTAAHFQVGNMEIWQVVG